YAGGRGGSARRRSGAHDRDAERRPRQRAARACRSPRARARGGRTADRRLAVPPRHHRVHGHGVLQARAHRDEGFRAAPGRRPRAPTAELPRAREAARDPMPGLLWPALERGHRRRRQEAEDRWRARRRVLLLRGRRARRGRVGRAADRSARAGHRGGARGRAAPARVSRRAPSRRDLPRLRGAPRRLDAARAARRRPDPGRRARPRRRPAAGRRGRVVLAPLPLFVELGGRPCIVFGGGAVAERKILALLAVGAVITVVSPTLSAALTELATAGLIAHVSRAYADADLAGAVLAFAATDDGAVNAEVAREGRTRGVWV